jgi:hypothetical protein
MPSARHGPEAIEDGGATMGDTTAPADGGGGERLAGGDAVPRDCDCGADGDDAVYVFDEQGNLVDEPVIPGVPGLPGPPVVPAVPSPLRPPIFPHPLPFARPCAISSLDGSWLLEIVPAFGGPGEPIFPPTQTRGPMRIEVGTTSLRISGDVYSRRMVVAQPRPAPVPAAAPAMPWYPQLPPSEYVWYFRSSGCTYAGGQLQFSFVRHLWDRSARTFTSTDTGQMTFKCRRPLVLSPGVAGPGALQMRGTATIGGRSYTVAATKTSTKYRGCGVEVDVMSNRQFPVSASLCSGVAVDFRSVYATAGWDVQVTVDNTAIADDPDLSVPELQTLIAGHQSPATDPNQWRLWLLVGSAQGSLFGLMFDDDTVPREGAVGFADPRFGNDSTIAPFARNQRLGAVPLAFLRTLVHEAGHALNLFHPKHDVHAPAIGTSIMNQTGDVMGFATTANPYPCNATLAFDEHSRTSLIHAPDAQVRPGWLNFGWGHGSLSAGLPAPIDADGLVNVDEDDTLRLELSLPASVVVGEYVMAEVSLANTGDAPREVTTLLNLSEGDLRLRRDTPDGRVDQVRDVVLACGPRPLVTLAPGESVTGRAQVFFTSVGHTFATPGPHVLEAELDVGDGLTVVRSAPVRVQVRMPVTEKEQAVADATLDRGVGWALALGDFVTDEAAQEKLAAVADAHADTDTGAAAALVLANSLARPLSGRGDEPARAARPQVARRYLDLAVQGRTAQRVAELATTVASAVDKDAPVVEQAMARVRRARKAKSDVARAEAVVNDFVQGGTPRP